MKLMGAVRAASVPWWRAPLLRWRRLWARWRPPRKLKTTTLGKIAIAMTIVIGVAAMNTGNNLLYLVLGALFGIIAASGVLSERVVKEIDVHVHPPVVATAGQPALISVRLTAHKRAWSFLLWVELLDAHGQLLARGFLRDLAPRGSRRLILRWTPEQRGLVTIGGVRLATRFPFQMYEKIRPIAMASRMWVAPVPTQALALPQGGAARGTRAQRRPMPGREEFSGLRERQPSDPPARIHWKRSAAVGMLMAKTFTADAGGQLHVVLTRGGSPQVFEAALGRLSATLPRARAQGLTVEVVAGASRAVARPDGSPNDVLLLLARVERDALPAGDGIVMTHRRAA